MIFSTKRSLCSFAILSLISSNGRAIQLDPVPPPLFVEHLTQPTPRPAIRDTKLAVVLGKALFWDMMLGEEGMACATCHHHAGADARPPEDPNQTQISIVDKLKSGVLHLINRSSKPDEPSNDASSRRYGSLGISHARFLREQARCEPPIGERQRTQRQAPSVINARFSHRLFWDGRASDTFNGVDPWGLRSPATSAGKPSKPSKQKKRMLFPEAALASQAMGPLTIPGEMICEGETFLDLARKVLPLKALSLQRVHPEDSVLGAYRDFSGIGLIMTYESLIQGVFTPSLWKSAPASPRKTDPTPPLIESNFGLFAGLALMAYEETLVSNQTPFDSPRTHDGYPSAYTAEQRRGLDLFNRLECDFCHSGTLFTAAATPLPYEQRALKWVDRRVIAPDLAHHSAQMAFMDVGFANIGLLPDGGDLGIGERDPYGNPLSYSAQYIEQLKGSPKPIIDDLTVDPIAFSIGYDVDFKPSELTVKNDRKIPLPTIAKEEGVLEPLHRLGAAINGAFKVPSLRNIELTGPYMHNGSLNSLDEVIDFYDRGGDFQGKAKVQTFVHAQHLTPEEKNDLKAFLLTLTDERVRWEKAPFDHPELRVPLDTPSDQVYPRLTPTRWSTTEAVGSQGRDLTHGPISAITFP